MLSQSLLLRKCDLRKSSPSPRPSPPGEGEASTELGNFMRDGAALTHGTHAGCYGWVSGADSATTTSDFGFRNSFVVRISEFRIRILPALSQIEREGALTIRLGRREVHRTGCVADLEEASQAAAFGLIGVHGQSVVVATAWMRDVIGTTSDRASVPTIHDVEDERRVHADGRLQTF